LKEKKNLAQGLKVQGTDSLSFTSLLIDYVQLFIQLKVVLVFEIKCRAWKKSEMLEV